ncbi:hypothetical protein ACIBKY_44415 [Nonomuraea sp. NPDC050394]|uniref:hypothetical protein n=1 Tax=Nonomuraea sp. NPDC050394 TaxID=3364363 RepID=UPI00378C1B1D
MRRRFLIAAVVLAAILLTALSVHALWAPWSGTAQPASDAPPGSATLTGGTARETVTLTVATPVTGATAVDVRLAPREGASGGPAPVVTISAVLPTAGHAVPDHTAVWAADGRHHVAALPLMMAGRWQILIAIDDGDRHSRLVFPLVIPR